MFIYGNRLHNYYWRVAVEKEQLLSTNILSSEVYHENLSLDLAVQFRAFIFVECPYREKTLDFIKKLKMLKKLVLFDILSYKDIQQELLDKVSDCVSVSGIYYLWLAQMGTCERTVYASALL